jgi:hypothetical protein
MAEAPFHSGGWEENIRSCVYIGVSCIDIYEMDGLYRLRLERHGFVQYWSDIYGELG